MTKRVKRMVTLLKPTTRLNSGTRDSRNGRAWLKSTNFRANGQINKGALADIRYYASVDRIRTVDEKQGTMNLRLTRSKTDIKTTYVRMAKVNGLFYDVFITMVTR